MPVVIGAVCLRNEINAVRGLGLIYMIEEQELNSASMLRKHAEIDAARQKSRAKREAFPRPLCASGAPCEGALCEIARYPTCSD